ncbi:DUF982 domain-containing protein [Aureimonas leprariae]|uniref:DUF982 domain-containing protein n=1 Tax=Plantimonas leprariae TaxID=2615207 RepID=A0A7V7PNV2_9HYPH|nr:DUF982 domain-containing protein [Aureimonas leprariae]KAB0679353.1 DUF982 domain-containing protein [Aureimonas leprariae]
MEYDRFEEPVWVYVGLNVPRMLETVTQAYVFLDDCPSTLRGPGYVAAKELCRRAMHRRTGAEKARRALAIFADRRGILAPAIGDLVAAQSAGILASRAAA